MPPAIEAAALLVHEGVLPEDFSTTPAGQLATTFLQDTASLRFYADEQPGE